MREQIDRIKSCEQFLNESIVDNSDFIYKHIEKTNPHSGERDAFQGIPSLKGYNYF